MTSALQCVGVTKRFGSLAAVSEVDLVVEPGARHALIGPNGAGKSTLFNLIAGTLRPSSGRILLDGVDMTRRSDAHRARHGLAKTFQHSNLFLSMSVADNVALAAQRLGGWGMQSLRRADRCPGVADRVHDCLARVGLGHRAGDLASDLSHGERRQLEVAVALATEPNLLLLDEPTAGMSAAETDRFCLLVESLPAHITVLIIEHDLEVVFRLAARITVLSLGEVLADGTAAEIRASEAVQSAYLGTSATDELFFSGVDR